MALSDYTLPLSATGTMISAAIAAITYVTATIQRNKITEQQRSLKIKENIQEITLLTRHIVSQLSDGYILISAASSVVDELSGQLSSDSSTEELKVLMGNSPMMLSVSVSGWHKNAAASEFYKETQRLSLSGDSLSGVYRIYASVIEILAFAIRDGYSPAIFRNLLDIMGRKENVELSGSCREILHLVKIRLQSDASRYFVARHLKAVEEIRFFIEKLTDALQNIKDSKLIKLSNMRKIDVVKAISPINLIESFLENLSNIISNEEKENLLIIISNIKIYTSKDYAYTELQN